MAGANEPVVWLLSDGAPGHVSQSQGLVDAIRRFRPLRVETVALTVRRAWLKSLGRWLVNLFPLQGRALLSQVYEMDLPTGRPDLIVSSGGNTLLANAVLARRFGVPNLYSGTLKRYRHSLFSTVYTVVPLAAPNNVVLSLPPVPANLAQALKQGEVDVVALLIGGDGAGYRYTAADWRALCEQINALGRAHGWRWLITTSRRTGAAAEAILAETLDSTVIAELVLWGREPRKVVRRFLERAERVVVTEDSLTMVAEAIYSGRPVCAVSPPVAQPDGNDGAALRAYVARGLLRRAAITDLSGWSSTPAVPGTGRPDVQAEIWASVQELLPT